MQTLTVCFFSPIYNPQTQERKKKQFKVTKKMWLRSSGESCGYGLLLSLWHFFQSTPQTRRTLSLQLNHFPIFHSNHFFHKAYALWGCLSTHSIQKKNQKTHTPHHHQQLSAYHLLRSPISNALDAAYTTYPGLQFFLKRRGLKPIDLMNFVRVTYLHTPAGNAQIVSTGRSCRGHERCSGF